MTGRELENLAKIGQLKREPTTRAEFAGLINSARKRLADARNETLKNGACARSSAQMNQGRERIETHTFNLCICPSG